MKRSAISIFTTVSVFMVMIFLPLFSVNTTACTALIAGKKTTTDGSILFAKTEDDGMREVDYLWFVPRKNHKDGDVIRLFAGGTIPQVKQTYAYFWDQCPAKEYSSFLMNEWGVAFGSDACRSKEDSVEELEKRGDLINGGIGFQLRFVLAQRAKTAREAVEIAAKLLDKYGYSASGRSLNIAGPKEAWILQMARGKHYVARRVQDDEVVLMANTYTIREVDLDDRENFICSPDLIDYAIKRGWYDPEKDGKFDFAKAYADEKTHTNPGNTRRHWMMAHMLNKNFPLTWQEAEKGLMPVSVKPDRKLTLKDIFTIFRNHFEGTELDKSKGYEKSPHLNKSRALCVYRTHRTTVIQQRDWMPAELGTVVWRALYEPCSSGFVPWYLAARDIPTAFSKAPEDFYTTKEDILDYQFTMPEKIHELDLKSASGIFGLMAGLIDADYNNFIGLARHEWDKFEKEQLLLQPVIEKTASELFKKDKDAAIEFLNQYTYGRAMKSLEIARKITNEIQWSIWGSGIGRKLRYAVDISPSTLNEYVGYYTSSDSKTKLSVEKVKNSLIVTDSNKIRYIACPESKTEFFVKNSGVRISFKKNAKEKKQKMIIHQRRKKIIAEKVK